MSRESQHKHFEDKIQEQVRLRGFPPNLCQPDPHHHHHHHYDHNDVHIYQEVVIRLWMGEAGVVVQSLQQAGHQPAFR